MIVQVEHLPLSGVLVLTPRRFTDERGYFTEVYSREAFAAATGIDVAFVQDNLSCSVAPGTIRGLHFQAPPFAQAKLVAVLRGAVLDVAVDLRRGSPSYGRHCTARLDAASGRQMFVPEGFAHGFCTLEPDTLVTYKVSARYAPDHDRGVHWADPSIGIPWPVETAAAVLSAKDRALPPLARLDTPFTLTPGSPTP